ncbi:MAG TPA: YdhK family protein [Ureibacillus sp.]|nr:YdhK family protein [Ureibacillus sp.]
MTKIVMTRIILLITALTLTACGGGNNKTSNESAKDENSHMAEHNTEETQGMNHSNMNHSESGEIPEGLKDAESPTFPVGSKAIIQSDHMEGMKGAEATIVGAYDTVVYTVSYTPTNGGDPVKNHKWVIHEELDGVSKAALEPGTQVRINSGHMEGMQGATATIDSAEKTTVYMVDYTSTTGEQVKNHKWVTESELKANE